MLYLFWSLVFLSVAQGIITMGQKCKPVQSVSNFDRKAYLGRWYEVVRDKDTSFEWMGKCVTADYGDEPYGLVSVTNRAWFWWWFFSYQKFTAIAKSTSTTGQGDIMVGFTFGSKEEFAKDTKNNMPNY